MIEELGVANTFVCVSQQLEYKHKENETKEYEKIFHFYLNFVL
jgi:hypothetical protein